MTLKAYALTTVSRFKTFADINNSDSDSLIEILINQATEFIENYCQRRFLQTAYSNQEIDGTGSETLFLDQYPVSSAASFTLQERDSAANEDDWSTIDSEDYFVDYESGIIHRTNRSHWRTGKKAYRASFTAGFDFDNSSDFLSDTEAGDVEYACWKLVNAMFTNRRSSSNVESESIGDYSVTFRKETLEDDELKNILDKYARQDNVGYTGPYLY